jgi:hypothetical protein
MENTRLLFCGSFSKNEDVSLEIFATKENYIRIIIEGDGIQIIDLNKFTAIRLSKELKKQISLID